MDITRSPSRMLIIVLIVHFYFLSVQAAIRHGNIVDVMLHDDCCIQYDSGENCQHRKEAGICSNHSLVTFEAEKSNGKKTFALADWSNRRLFALRSWVRTREFFSPPVNGTQSIVKVFSNNTSKSIHALTSIGNESFGLYRYSISAVGNKLKVSIYRSIPRLSSSLLSWIKQKAKNNESRLFLNIHTRQAHTTDDCDLPQTVVSVISLSVRSLDEQLILYENTRARWMNDQILRIGARVDLEIRTGWTSLVLPIFSSAAFLLVGLALMNKFFNIHLQ
uniref:Uncharacterized protein n=1 Tax=Ditylenchus dipsaci TaxID=166011 RepID=A0A915CVS4_9BILA